MNLVMRVAREVVRYDADAKPGAVISRAHVDHGYVVIYNQAYRALETLRKSYKTTSELSYGLVLPWLQGMHCTSLLGTKGVWGTGGLYGMILTDGMV
jgi:hypothetical protein